MSLRKAARSMTGFTETVFDTASETVASGYYAAASMKHRTKRMATKQYRNNQLKEINDEKKLIDKAKKAGIDPKKIDMTLPFKDR
jgi:predicted DsbA family dithiol-disulfide isomerase